MKRKIEIERKPTRFSIEAFSPRIQKVLSNSVSGFVFLRQFKMSWISQKSILA